MAVNESHPDREVFIIHLWRATSNDTVWRGRIQNVRTGQCRSASNLDELAELFEHYFSEEGSETPPTQEKGLK